MVGLLSDAFPDSGSGGHSPLIPTINGTYFATINDTYFGEGDPQNDCVMGRVRAKSKVRG